MKTSLMVGMDDSTKKEFKSSWVAGRFARERLSEVLKAKKENLQTQMVSRDLVKSPQDYGLVVASIAAEVRKIDELLSLLSD